MALAKEGYRQRFQTEDALRLYGLKWYDYFHDLPPKASHEQCVALQAASFALSDANPELIARHMHPAPYAHEVLQTIADSSHEQILISNTVPATVPLFLKALDMQLFF